jgi:outer membrane protein
MKNTAKTTIARLALAPLVLGLAATAAMAQTYTFKIGAGRIDPRATSGDLTGTLPTNVPANGFGIPTAVPLHGGNQMEVMPKSTLLFSIERSIDDHWGVELMLGIPPTHDVKLRASQEIMDGAVRAAALTQAGINLNATSPTDIATAIASTPGATAAEKQTNYFSARAAAKVAPYNGTTVARVKQMAPTLFFNYKFREASAAFRPYVGVGVNYTTFKIHSTQAGDDLYNDGPVRISSTDSIGLAFQIGANYKFDKNWLVSAGWSTAAVKNNVTVRTDNSQQELSYRFHPSVFSVMVGYQF